MATLCVCVSGPMSWVQAQMLRGVNPRLILSRVLGATAKIPEGVNDVTLWRLIVNMLSEPPRREKLRHINTIEDVVRLMKSCRKVIVLTGAGVSWTCVTLLFSQLWVWVFVLCFL